MSPRPSFGDHVRIRPSAETEAAGFAGRSGMVNGVTTPSVTNVTVIGVHDDDYALAVMFEDNDTAWFAEHLVEFLDHAPGMEIRVGNVKAVRREDGSWLETRLDESPVAPPEPSKPWWKFWR